MSAYFRSFLFLFCISGIEALAEPLAGRIKVGVSVTLSGEAATFGEDMKNAILLANEDLQQKYRLIIEDEKCSGKGAVSAANKLINIDKVSYVVGFSCNQTILSAGPVYQNAGVVAISGFGTTGDVKGVGDKLFRLFPPDNYAIDKIYPYIAAKHKRLGIITEQNEFPELLRRTFEKNFQKNYEGYFLYQEDFQTGDQNLKPLLLKLKSYNVEALFIAANAEAGFMRVVKQMREIGYYPAIYTAFFPGIKIVQDTVGKYIDGMVFVDLPGEENLYSERGLEVLRRFRKKYGEPNSAPYSVLFGYETLRLLDEAIENGSSVQSYLQSVHVRSGVLGSYRFDEDGASSGLGFRLFRFKDGKVFPIEEVKKTVPKGAR